ncbi:trehalose-phosphatase [Plastoroseomonas arctica]|uniref:Trehalose 6-phosphate phosphatase n=1 Tax=Plastoroseomonas arctica TaxID=1509237 RepID=A0AAF1JVK1_9PROT|nr:trehalose-phosphatase [Plastoroseomonas arctica]MBR0654652.1 trehalose-phosphatase [Plastoroseomonas arctica]
MSLTRLPPELPPPPEALLQSSSLFLDFDGTLVEIAATPDAVLVDAGLRDLLAALARHYGPRVAIVSGRSIAQLDALIGPVARMLAISGSHGSEHRFDGGEEKPLRPRSLDAVEARMRDAAARHPGALVEPKSFGVALHYRLAPGFEGEARTLVEALAAASGLAVQAGKMMVEARIPGSDKGVAVTRLMQRAGMAGTKPVFLGDDLTDEAGFEAARALGGTGILVGNPRPTAAAYRLDNPAAVRSWLAGGMA